MDNSILLAKFLGPYIMVIGIGLLFNLKAYPKIIKGFFENAALVYISGLMTFVAGLAIVLFHNVWATDWRVIITFFGWSALVKGALLVICPGVLARMSGAFVKNIKLLAIPWVVMLALGIFLTMKGF